MFLSSSDTSNCLKFACTRWNSLSSHLFSIIPSLPFPDGRLLVGLFWYSASFSSKQYSCHCFLLFRSRQVISSCDTQIIGRISQIQDQFRWIHAAVQSVRECLHAGSTLLCNLFTYVRHFTQLSVIPSFRKTSNTIDPLMDSPFLPSQPFNFTSPLMTYWHK